jgi:hypothetical protein
MLKAILISLFAGAAYMIGQLFVSKHQVEVNQVITRIENSIQKTLGKQSVGTHKPEIFHNYQECYTSFLSKNCKLHAWGINENHCVELSQYTGEALFADAQQCYLGAFIAGKFHGKGMLYHVQGEKYVGLFLAGQKAEPTPQPDIPKPHHFENYEACHQYFTQRECKPAMVWNVALKNCQTRQTQQGEGVFSLNEQCYWGAFHAGKYQGHGILYYLGGERYEGNFLAGKKHGLGTLTTSSSQLTGEWLEDKWVSAAK